MVSVLAVLAWRWMEQSNDDRVDVDVLDRIRADKPSNQKTDQLLAVFRNEGRSHSHRTAS